eukprot:TRINITY_DN8991_c0_g2_i1.p1 TRINITY_DN8991_c0_g2~~TRINITY_DN8991_c0_g2_i1.p1  ORF type:complete len:146 (-),score=19.48 TRINITY_DN8991_c0_g2_i1:26-463(-)
METLLWCALDAHQHSRHRLFPILQQLICTLAQEEEVCVFGVSGVLLAAFSEISHQFQDLYLAFLLSVIDNRIRHLLSHTWGQHWSPILDHFDWQNLQLRLASLMIRNDGLADRCHQQVMCLREQYDLDEYRTQLDRFCKQIYDWK